MSKEENYWLHSLRNDLKAGGEIRDFMEKCDRHRSSVLYQALADTVLRANWKEAEAEKKMVCGAIRELFKEDFDESQRRGREKGREEGIFALIKILLGEKTKEQIVAMLVQYFSVTEQQALEYFNKYGG